MDKGKGREFEMQVYAILLLVVKSHCSNSPLRAPSYNSRSPLALRYKAISTFPVLSLTFFFCNWGRIRGVGDESSYRGRVPSDIVNVSLWFMRANLRSDLPAYSRWDKQWWNHSSWWISSFDRSIMRAEVYNCILWKDKVNPYTKKINLFQLLFSRDSR